MRSRSTRIGGLLACMICTSLVSANIGGDSGEGARLGDFKGRAAGFGPAVYLNRKLFDKDIYFSVKWLHEFNVRNRLEGDHVFASFSLSL